MFKKVLIPVDVSVEQETQGLLSAAKTLTKDWGADLHVVSVVPSVGMPIVGSYLDKDFEAQGRETVSRHLADALSKAEIDATPHVKTGTVYDCVLTLAASLSADLIIIGAHHPELRDYLLGSNAARVVRHSSQSVLVLRSS